LDNNPVSHDGGMPGNKIVVGGHPQRCAVDYGSSLQKYLRSSLKQALKSSRKRCF
jgi:D-tyrosyl-tRNA(Tyr) deacylase